MKISAEWLTAAATSLAAFFTWRAASAARKSTEKQAELIAVDIRPVLGLTNALCGFFPENCYPLHLYFTNHGKGAAWLFIVNAYENGVPIKADVGTPVL